MIHWDSFLTFHLVAKFICPWQVKNFESTIKKVIRKFCIFWRFSERCSEIRGMFHWLRGMDASWGERSEL